MKATIFSKPMEYCLEAVGEKWRQGEVVKGSLTIRNHGFEKSELENLSVTLCEGNYKKIKEKDQRAWKEILHLSLAESTAINPNAEVGYSFEFKLPENCLVTDKSGSLYLLIPSGHIELVINPKEVISKILEIFENFLRFKVTQTKYSKGMVEVKLIPPASRDFSTIKSLVLSLVEMQNELKLAYHFNMHVLDMAGATMQTQKKSKKIDQLFHSKQYLLFGGSINQDFLLQEMSAALSEVKPKFL